MKSILLFVIILLYSVKSGFAQISLGVRDNKYVLVGYTLKEHYLFQLDQSNYSSKVGAQYIRGSLGYRYEINALKYVGHVYFGSAYDRTYHNAGALAFIDYNPFKLVSLYGAVNPHYDSYYKFNICYRIGLVGHIYKDIDLLAYYTTIPEYRQSEKRIRVGANFHVNNLWVEPTISIPTENPIKSVRFLVSFGYTFKNNLK